MISVSVNIDSIGSLISEIGVKTETLPSLIFKKKKGVAKVTNVMLMKKDELFILLKTKDVKNLAINVSLLRNHWDNIPSLVKQDLNKDKLDMNKFKKNWEAFIAKYPDGEVPDPDPETILEDS